MGVKRRKAASRPGGHASQQVGPEHCSAGQLREEGWALGELKKACYDCAALREVGLHVVNE